MSTLPAQRGAVLLIMLAILGLGSSWFLVSALNAETGGLEAQRTKRNAETLQRAKLALIGYVAAQAIKAGENNPGAMPCPENPGDFDSTTGREGLVGTSCGTTTIGRFPWRTLGMEKLVDAAGEPLWYVVGPGWGVPSGSNTVINSNSVGQLTVDGVANAAVALIIAPGPAFSAPASTGCTAFNQTRSPTGTPDWRNYLECENATSPANATFVTTKPSIVDPVTKAITPVSNDQVIAITAADVMPAIEAAITSRIQREIVPALNNVYTPGAWGFAGANPLYPYPAPFAHPGPGAGTSSYQGSTGTCATGICRGLLPFNQIQNCTVSASEPRCTMSFLAFSKASADVKTGGTGSIRTQSSCAWQSNLYVCTGEYEQPTISATIRIRVSNVAMGLRTFDASKVSFVAVDDVGSGWGAQTIPHTATAALNADGSATVTIAGGTLPSIATAGWGTYANYVVSIDRAAFGDHALLDATNATTGWFARNQWYRLVYYASAQSVTSSSLPLPACVAGLNCLTVTNMSPSNGMRAILVFTGQSINGRPRPSSSLSDYLEFGNASGNFERQPIGRGTSAMQLDTGSASAYTVPVPSMGTNGTFQFRAANTNTGPSTLSTPATGTRDLVESGGSALSAGRIQANGAVQVTYDGTRFLLSRRPFNDRIVVIASN